MPVKAREWPGGWQMPSPRAVQNLQMPHPRDWQGRQMPSSCPDEGGGGVGAGGIDWCSPEATNGFNFQIINSWMESWPAWYDCNSSFRNLRIILSDLRIHNTLQFVKCGASAQMFFTLLSAQNEVKELLPVNWILYYLHVLNICTTAPASSISSQKKPILSFF